MSTHHYFIFQFNSQFPVDHLYTISVTSLVLLWRQFAALTHDINHFVFDTTLPIQLCMIDFVLIKLVLMVFFVLLLEEV